MRSRMSCSVRWAFNFGAWDPSEEEWTKAVSCIQTDELSRIEGFVFKKDAKASMVGRLMMRKMAVERLGISNDLLRFARNDHEKPFLVNKISPSIAPSLSFNVSHQGSFCLFASESDRPIGVDIMKIEYSGGKSLPEFFRLMRRQFTAKEWATISAPSSESEQIYRFCRHWESYVKALGVGVGFDLQRVGFRLETERLCRNVVTTDTLLEVDGVQAANWTFEETMIDDEHCAAVALCSKAAASHTGSLSNVRPLFEVISFDELARSLIPLCSMDSSRWLKFSEKLERPV